MASLLRDSIASYQYYIDFDKIYRNIADVKVELNILNSLIGSKQIEADFEKNCNPISGDAEVYPDSFGCSKQRNLCDG